MLNSADRWPGLSLLAVEHYRHSHAGGIISTARRHPSIDAAINSAQVIASVVFDFGRPAGLNFRARFADLVLWRFVASVHAVG